MQKFTPRNDKSIWSELNKRRVEKMIAEGKMTESGLKKINEAKRNGSWNKLAGVNNTDIVPADFNSALQTNKKAVEYFKSLSTSNKKLYLWWIISAKREDTRSKRIREAIKKLSQGKKLGMQ
ncbi:MAG: YdeI/OmpD-associated family protein [Nitrospirae bacterium]|nr:YdeI/OmpD-associated family protein [Nitrospirota bacterium]